MSANRDNESKKSLVNLGVGLVLGYASALILMSLPLNGIVYYTGGFLFIASAMMTFVLFLGVCMLYWDMKKESGSGYLGKAIRKYDEMVSIIADCDDKKKLEDLEMYKKEE